MGLRLPFMQSAIGDLLPSPAADATGAKSEGHQTQERDLPFYSAVWVFLFLTKSFQSPDFKRFPLPAPAPPSPALRRMVSLPRVPAARGSCRIIIKITR